MVQPVTEEEALENLRDPQFIAGILSKGGDIQRVSVCDLCGLQGKPGCARVLASSRCEAFTLFTDDVGELELELTRMIGGELKEERAA